MGRLLAQLFEITALFEMRLRPELVLLQKTMVTVEGVARRIDPQSDIWAAAKPVVERWIARELSVPARLATFARDASSTVRGLARLAEILPEALTPRAERRVLELLVLPVVLACLALAASAFAVGVVLLR